MPMPDARVETAALGCLAEQSSARFLPPAPQSRVSATENLSIINDTPARRALTTKDTKSHEGRMRRLPSCNFVPFVGNGFSGTRQPDRAAKATCAILPKVVAPEPR